jgi:ABC-type lipoprotein release transport system permease subunit
VLLEGGLLLCISLIVGLPCAYLMNALQQIAMQNLMGIYFGLQTREVIGFVVFLAGLVLVACYLPARQAGRTNILEAMRYE